MSIRKKLFYIRKMCVADGGVRKVLFGYYVFINTDKLLTKLLIVFFFFCSYKKTYL